MNNFGQRAVTGLTFAFIVAFAILFSVYTFAIVFLIINVLGLVEFYRLVKTNDHEPQLLLGVIVSLVILFIGGWIFWNRYSDYFFMGVASSISLIFIYELFRNKKNPFINIAITLTGLLYITLPILLLFYIAFGLQLHESELYNGEVIMGCMFLVWSSDTGAYMIGTKFGKNRLFERISPKKSWEGLVGGMLYSLLAAYILSITFNSLLLVDWLILAIIIVIFGTLGDLIESMLKRSIGVKDSGAFFPGHGGILDRFDGLLVCVPFVLLYLMLTR